MFIGYMGKPTYLTFAAFYYAPTYIYMFRSHLELNLFAIKNLAIFRLIYCKR